jgi:cyanophycinase
LKDYFPSRARRLLRAGPSLLLALLLGACAGPEGGQTGTFPDYRLPSLQPTVAIPPIPQEPGRGTLVLDGGGYSDPAILSRIVAEAGVDPTLCLIDTAFEGGVDLRRFFRGYEGVELRAVEIDGANADSPALADLLRSCSGYFFGGGNPQRLSTALRPDGRDSRALGAIRETFETEGAALSGASAGAMIVGPITLCECGAGSSMAALTYGQLFQAPGFELVDGVLVDAHFFTRGLLGRHLYALARNGIPIGVGIDEETAVVVPSDDGLWEVIGRGAVAVIERPVTAAVNDLRDFTISVLSPGDRFDPYRGTFALAPDRRPVVPDGAGKTGPVTTDDIFAVNRVLSLLTRLAESPATEAIGTSPNGLMRVTFRETEETEVYTDGSGFSILHVAVSIDRVAG